MSRVEKKLKSERGASITFALLLFLVCAVLSSIIIVAATTSSGRMSKLAETDQRYYSVISAAVLLKDIINENNTVSIVKVENSWEDTVYSQGIAGVPAPAVVPVGELSSATYIVNKSASEIDIDRDFVEANEVEANESENTNFQHESITKDAAYNICQDNDVQNRAFTLSSSIYEKLHLGFDSLSVDMLESINADGDIVFTIYNRVDQNGNESRPGNRYTLQLYFSVQSKESNSEKEKESTPRQNSDGSYTVTTKKTSMVVTTLVWNLDSIIIPD